MPTIQLPRKMQPILATKARIIVLIGGRSSGKSEGVARFLMMKSQTESADVLCGREYQNSIDDSVHKLLTGLIVKLDVQGVESTEKKIDFIGGGGFRYKGFARNSAAVKSAQDFKYSWIEEAQDLSEKSIEDLLPTIRATDSKLIFTGNPQASADPFSQRFIVPFKKALDRDGYYEDDMHLIIMMNWRDNPWHGELEKQRLWDKENLSRAKYDHIWEGAFNDEIDDSIIKAEWFDAAIDAHKKIGFKPRGATIASHDPSDEGLDDKAFGVRKGSVLLDIKSKATGDANEGADWAADEADEYKPDYFIWDCDGLGISLKRQFSASFSGKKTELILFKGSESAEYPDEIYQPIESVHKDQQKTNKETFRNKRAQYYWRLRDRFYNTYRAIEHGEYINTEDMISISSEIKEIQQLRSEVCRIPKKPNGNGLIQIMTKKEMKEKHKIASPNLADTLMQLMYIPENKDDSKEFLRDIHPDLSFVR